MPIASYQVGPVCILGNGREFVSAMHASSLPEITPAAYLIHSFPLIYLGLIGPT